MSKLSFKNNECIFQFCINRNELHSTKPIISIKLYNQLLKTVPIINPVNSSVLASGLIIIQNMSQNTSTITSLSVKRRMNRQTVSVITEGN